MHHTHQQQTRGVQGNTLPTLMQEIRKLSSSLQPRDTAQGVVNFSEPWYLFSLPYGCQSEGARGLGRTVPVFCPVCPPGTVSLFGQNCPPFSMRRSEKEMREVADMEALLREAPVCRLGLCDGGRPYVVPVSFVYERGAIWIHSAPAGEKIRILRKHPWVCVEVDAIGQVIPAHEPCRWTVSYRSVIAEGTAKWVEEPREKARALAALVRKYSGQDGVKIPPGGLEGVVVIRIPLSAMTGKVSTGS